MACKQNTISAISHHGGNMLDNGSPTLPKQLIFHVLVSFKVPQYTGLDLSMRSQLISSECFLCLCIFHWLLVEGIFPNEATFEWVRIWLDRELFRGKSFSHISQLKGPASWTRIWWLDRWSFRLNFFLTNITMERFLSLVIHFVTFHVLNGFEICIALFAFERFFSCVNFLVIGQTCHRFQ